MAANVYTLTQNWSPSARFTAAAAGTVIIANPSTSYWMRFTRGPDDTLPTAVPSTCSVLAPGERQLLTLALNDRVWFATDFGGLPAPVGTLET